MKTKKRKEKIIDLFNSDDENINTLLKKMRANDIIIAVGLVCVLLFVFFKVIALGMVSMVR